MKEDPAGAIRLLSKFAGENLTRTLSRIETDVRGLTADQALGFLKAAGAERDVLAAAGEMNGLRVRSTSQYMRLASCCVSRTFSNRESASSMFCLARATRDGNSTLKLTAALRIQIYKLAGRFGVHPAELNIQGFLHAGGQQQHEAQNSVLARNSACTEISTGGRSIKSVLSRGDKVQVLFFERFGDRYRKVKDYFHDHHHAVSIVDVTPWLGELAVAVRSPALMVAPEADQL
ncbi:hypothetical protein [Mesorhizobium australicum]|uniref:hypothetical protein n=1 Tax=Mesorhizobium australicum TaxID=536018 RepID=UPI00333C07B1